MRQYFLFIVIGYVSGSVLYSYLLPLGLKHVDVTALSADHNPGAANAFMFAGVPVGIACVACDLLKGFVPVYLACRYVDIADWLFALVMVAPVVGHAFPLIAPKKGGKGIAVSFGALAGLLPRSFIVFLLAALYLLMTAFALIKPHGHLLRSVVVFGLFAVMSVFLAESAIVSTGCVLISSVVICKHVAARRRELATEPVRS